MQASFSKKEIQVTQETKAAHGRERTESQDQKPSFCAAASVSAFCQPFFSVLHGSTQWAEAITLEFWRTRYSSATRRDKLYLVPISNFLWRNSDWSNLGWASTCDQGAMARMGVERVTGGATRGRHKVQARFPGAHTCVWEVVWNKSQRKNC